MQHLYPLQVSREIQGIIKIFSMVLLGDFGRHKSDTT